MSDERGECFECGHALCCLDDDPNGSRNATCARCRAQEAHDYDAEPGAVFSRSGEREYGSHKRGSAMPEADQANANHWPRGGQAKSSGVGTAMADYLRAWAPKLDAAESPNNMGMSMNSENNQREKLVLPVKAEADFFSRDRFEEAFVRNKFSAMGEEPSLEALEHEKLELSKLRFSSNKYYRAGEDLPYINGCLKGWLMAQEQCAEEFRRLNARIAELESQS